MTPGQPATVGFYGPGHITRANAKKLLEFWFFADPVVVLPKDWAAPPELREIVRELFPDAAEEPDIIEALLDDRANGQDVELVVLWDEHVDSATLAVVRRAREAKIPVRNLCQALDDLTADMEQGTRAISSSPAQEEVTTPPAPEPQVAPVIKVKNRRERSPGPSEQELREKIDLLRSELAEAEEALVVLAATQEAKATTGEKPTAYIPDGRGGWKRRGAGRPRSGEQTLWLTKEQAREKGIIK